MKSVAKPLFFVLMFFSVLSFGQAQNTSEKKPSGQLRDLPIPVNESVQGIKIPYFNSDGKIQMHFDAKTARRVDEDHLALSFLNIEIFDDNGEPDMKIELPSSTLDLKTEIISSTQEVQLQNKSFQLTGASMVFNTNTREGLLRGKVRMVILNRSLLSGQNENSEKSTKQSSK